MKITFGMFSKIKVYIGKHAYCPRVVHKKNLRHRPVFKKSKRKINSPTYYCSFRIWSQSGTIIFYLKIMIILCSFMIIYVSNLDLDA